MSVRRLQLRWPTSCSACGLALAKGATAVWCSEAKAATCPSCADDQAATYSRGAAGPVADDGPASTDRVQAGSGVAGASARREFERRSTRERRLQERVVAEDAAWREHIVESRPLLGRAATIITPKPVVGPPSQRTRAWAEGAVGEELLGRHLAALPDKVVVLHDRRIPGSKANIDHIAVAPSGVFVIDAKNYDGRVEVRDVGSWLRTDERLYVNGRDRTRLVGGIDRQVATVRSALPEGLPVRGVLCFAGEWPLLFRRPLTVRGVQVVWPSKLVDQLNGPGPLPNDDVRRIADALAAGFPPA